MFGRLFVEGQGSGEKDVRTGVGREDPGVELAGGVDQ